MRIYREKDYDAMSRRAANIISAEVIRRPDCVLGWQPVLHPLEHTNSLQHGTREGISALRKYTP